MQFVLSIREKLSGYKTYLLLAFAGIIVTVQFASGIDFGVPGIPPVETIGAFLEQLWNLALAGAFRSALNKV